MLGTEGAYLNFGTLRKDEVSVITIDAKNSSSKSIPPGIETSISTWSPGEYSSLSEKISNLIEFFGLMKISLSRLTSYSSF